MTTALRNLLGEYATAVAAAYRDCNEVARPGLRSYEHVTTGMRSFRAARHVGMLAYPPTEMTTCGCNCFSNAFAAPSARSQRLGPVVKHRQAPRHSHIRHMGDQRVEPWPSLGLIYPRHRQIRHGIAAKAVNRLGREGDKLCGAQQSHSALHAIGIGG